MATREIAKHQPQYVEPDLDPELITIPDEPNLNSRSGADRLRLIWESRSLLYRWLLVGFVASVVIAFVIPVRYTATTRLMPPDQAGQGMMSMLAALGKSSDLGALGSELFGVKTSGDLFVGIAKSETVQNAIIEKFDLRKVYGLRRLQDARKELENRTDVSADRKSGIITIKVDDHSPTRAAQLGQEYVAQLNQLVITLDTSAAHRERIFLENRLAQVEHDLESAEKDFSQFSSKTAALDVKEQGKAMISAAGELEGQLIAAQTELEGLRQIYTNDNIRVRAVQARINEYKRQLQKMGGQPGNATTDASGNPAAGENTELYPTIRQLPILGVTWADLYRRTRVEEAVFETLTKQYEIAKVDEAREVPSVKVLDPAEVPEKKSFPPRTLLVAAGTLLSLILASGWILGSDRWGRIDPSDPRKVLANEVRDSLKNQWRTFRSRSLKSDRPQSS
jgi:capsule polysaccharide export protein KpsE/RkpR